MSLALMLLLSTVSADPNLGDSYEKIVVVGKEIRISNGLTMPTKDVRIPARERGLIGSLDVRLGDEVKRGQKIGQLQANLVEIQNRIAALELEIARLNAQNETEELIARKTAEVAKSELEHSKALSERVQAVAEQQIMRERLTHERALAQLELARMSTVERQLSAKVKQAELEIAMATLNRHEVRTPMDGVIVDTFVAAGEWVEPGQAIARLIKIDRVYVECFLPIDRFPLSMVRNRPVRIERQRPNGKSIVMLGRVAEVSPEVLTGGQYRVRAVVDNQQVDGEWLLLPGTNTSLVIELK